MFSVIMRIIYTQKFATVSINYGTVIQIMLNIQNFYRNAQLYIINYL